MVLSENDVDEPLPVFTGSQHVPQPNLGYDMAQRDLYRLQPLREVIQQLLWGPLIGAALLWTFFSHWVQLFRQWGLTMWMYPRPSCPDHPFSIELDDMEINMQIRGVLAYGDDLNLCSNPIL
jgi:hypothetical protein